MPNKITASYRIVTPMFIGDAHQQASCISPSSVKGALRFWWRALNWGKVLAKAGNNEAAALCELHAQEVKLFGGLAETVNDEQTGGQGLFLLRVASQNNLKILHDWPLATSFSGYLGVGLWESGNQTKGNYQPHRQALEEGQDFSVELRLKSTTHEDDKKALEDTLKAWGWFGGLGSRVRRGFGSIALEQLNGKDVAFACADDYVDATKVLLAAYAVNNTTPPYTAFSSQTLLGLAATKANARSAHDELGRLFKSYRGQPSSLRGSKKRVFGMPYSGGTPEEAEARRASPLIFHIHPIANKYKGLVLSLPAVFHHKESLQEVDDRSLQEVDDRLLSGFIKQLQEVSLWT